MNDAMKHRAAGRRARCTGDEALARLAEAAVARGLALLSTDWQGRHHPYLFRCAQGHEFSRIATVMLRGTATCLQCVQDEVGRRFLDTLQQLGVVCDQAGFPGQNTRCRFTCGHGHEWSTEARKIMEGHGCPTCGHARRSEQMTLVDGLERLRSAAAERGGKCLADTYRGMRARYDWECANGHRWSNPGSKVVQGHWCRKCFARRNGDAQLSRDGLARLKAVAASHGGQCLADVYTGSAAKYQFRCAKGHEWNGIGSLVLGGTWCGICANGNKQLGIARMHEIARERGGRCLSDEYLGTKVKLMWECGSGHVWQSTPGTVIHRGAWCPNCFRLRVTHNPRLRRRYDVQG